MVSLQSCTELQHKKHKNRPTKLLKTTVHIKIILVGLFRIVRSLRVRIVTELTKAPNFAQR